LLKDIKDDLPELKVNNEAKENNRELSSVENKVKVLRESQSLGASILGK
jgi:hypothetical protein